MPQSLSRVVLHTIFSTKDRFAFLQNPEFRAEVHAYLGGCAKSLHCLPIQIGGVSDHVHLLTTLARTIAIADFVKEVKRVSSCLLSPRCPVEDLATRLLRGEVALRGHRSLSPSPPHSSTF